MKAEEINLEALEAREALHHGERLKTVTHGNLTVELVRYGADMWHCFRRGKDGGIALRTPLFTNTASCDLDAGADFLIRWTAQSDLGVMIGTMTGEATGLEQFRLRVEFTPASALHIPYLPRDLVPFGRGDDPQHSVGTIEAVQRGLNTGLCYLNLAKPRIGKLLYVQNLTELNPYFLATETTPKDSVGGQWPVLGYRAPIGNPGAATQLPAGKTLVLYDTHLVFRSKTEQEESESAWQFLDMLGAIYRSLDKPATQQRDWIGRAKRTLRDLASSRKARDRHFGELYFHPYTNAEHPDSMVQLSLMVAIHDWGVWDGTRHPLENAIRRGLDKFYDPKIRAMRRYLPDVGDDKNANAVDSWYLYHPMLNLSNLALAGDETAKRLFLQSIDYGIKAAQHFEYKWPIQYDVTDFSVITPVAPSDHRGQTDVGGIYAWVMLQAFELTAEVRFLDEARNALDAARGMRFNLNYQANLTAWGAAACIRLWRITNQKSYLALSYVYLASFFHNAQIWESELGHAPHYSNFLAVTCLQDAPYMALYECFDSYAAFERFLDLGGPDLIPSAKLLVTEYCRYALDRAWYYYPDALPEDALAEKQRNGEIDRALSFPVEDLYPDGQPAGQVGQEIYGAGAAMIFATRSFHQIEDAPFLLFCDHFLRAKTRIDSETLSVKIDGDYGQDAELILLKNGRKALPSAVIRTLNGHVIEPQEHSKDFVRYLVPATGLIISWSA